MSTAQGSWARPKIVNDGLVLYLDANAPNSYSQYFTTTTWRDLSGNSNNGTLTNGPTFNSGNGGSIVFDGVDDSMLHPDMVNIRLTDVTFNFIFKPNHINSDLDLLNKGTHINNAPLLIWFDKMQSAGINIGNVDCISVIVYDGINSPLRISSPSYTIEQNTTYVLDVVITPSTNNLAIYLNGTLSNSHTQTYNGIQNISSDFRLASSGTQQYHFSGNMYSYKVYNKALTSDEILQNYNATKARFGL